MKTITIEFINGRENIEVQAKDLKSAIEQFVQQGANLSGADLSKADLSGADLIGTDLSGANLSGADLAGTNLEGANLSFANLSNANLSGVDLRYANLSGADLTKANLSRADLYRANLSGANLIGANLIGADLSGADLIGADLTDVKGLDYQICPEKGSFIAYKATTKGVIKIEILEDAERTSCIRSKKCRASKIKVLDGNGCGGSSPTYTKKSLIYNKGNIIEADSFNSDPREECTHGIHFFMSKQEALDWFNRM